MIADTQLARLDEKQRRQVAENLGLVAVHLRRHGPSTATATRDREWADLFQEGCLGLIQAVRTFRIDSGIAFPAYALPRIHTAVSRAMRGAFSTVRQPLYPRKHKSDKPQSTIPSVRSLDFDPPDRRPDPRHALESSPADETIGERLRARYVDSLARVVRRMQRSRPGRQDRGEVIERIVQERLLVPEVHARTPLRAIARETNSSYTRIAKCEKRILDLVRADLADDAETQHLRQAARRSRAGLGSVIDPGLTDEIERFRIDRFVARLANAPAEQRTSALLTLIEAAGTSVEAIARSLLDALPSERRAAVTDDPAFGRPSPD